MGITFTQAWNELKGVVPYLEPLMAQKLVQRAWDDIQRSRRWSFMQAETIITTPAITSGGTVTVTQGSATVTGDATADAAWAALGAATLETMQFRIGYGPLYNITDYTSPTLTLEHTYGETTAAGAAYQIFKIYYDAPSDFLKWDSVIDPIMGIKLTTNWTRSQIDLIDPQRASIGTPSRIITYRYEQQAGAVAERWRYELWPIPNTYRNYNCIYLRNAWDLGTSQELPAIICDNTLMACARSKAYEWAAANAGAHPEMLKVNWLQLKMVAQAEYKDQLGEAQKRDEEIFRQNEAGNYTMKQGSMYGYGMSANWWQSHAPWFSR